MSDETQIQKLLRLKRYELPPEGYYTDFLREFQRRQRAEVLKSSVWEILWDRLGHVLPDFRVPTYAYAAIGLMAVAASSFILTTGEVSPPLAVRSADPGVTFDLNSKAAELQQPVEIPATRVVGTLPPHYVLQPRPAVKDEPYRF
ncbi:MAG TPA: hypothetical protein VIS74_03465 [Chthoniobacterales bacterium]